MLRGKIIAMALTVLMTASALADNPLPADTAALDSSTIDSNSVESLVDSASTVPDSAVEDFPSEEFIAAASDSSWWYRKIDNKAFGLGEYLEFGVKYGMLPAGTAILKIPEIVQFDGKSCFKIVSIASSNNVVSVFYRVRDSVETLVDYDGIFSRKFHKKLSEGGYQIDRTTLFNQRLHLAVTDADTIPTYAFVQDALSSLYYIRTQELEPGKDVFVDNHTDRKNFPLKIIVYRRETVEVPAGKFECVVIEPIMRAEGIFKAKGRIWIWLSDDRYKLPVMMKTEVFFLGSVSAQLRKYTLGTFEGTHEQVQEN